MHYLILLSLNKTIARSPTRTTLEILPIGGLHNPAAMGIMPSTILISPNDNPICLACKIINGYKPNSATN